MLIQVDIDNTLYDSNKVFRTAGKEYGLEWPLKYSEWFGPEYIGTDLPTLLNLFKKAHSKEYVMKNKPYPNAMKVLKGLAEDYNDLEIAYISDRNVQQGVTLKAWLEQEGFLINEDQHVEATKDKRHWMREHKPEIVIDDRVRTMMMARFELGAQVVSLEFPYNVNLKNEVPGIHIVPDWLAIDKVLREKIIPNVQEVALSREHEKRYAIV